MIGAKLSVNVAEALKYHITKADIVQVASMFNLKEWDLKHVIWLETNVADKHVAAIIELRNRAIKNAKNAPTQIKLLKTLTK